jgi:hypothetical protein
MAEFKVCRCCGSKTGLRRRKCPAKFCRGDMFREPTQAEIDFQADKDRAAQELLRDLLEHYNNPTIVTVA